MITVGDIRKAIEGLPDDAEVCNSVDESPDEWTARIVGVTRGIPEHWKGVGYVTKVPEDLWICIEIVPMDEDDSGLGDGSRFDDEDLEKTGDIGDDKDDAGLQEDVDAHC